MHMDSTDAVDNFREAIRNAIEEHEENLSLRQIEFVLQEQSQWVRQEETHSREDKWEA